MHRIRVATAFVGSLYATAVGAEVVFLGVGSSAGLISNPIENADAVLIPTKLVPLRPEKKSPLVMLADAFAHAPKANAFTWMPFVSST